MGLTIHFELRLPAGTSEGDVAARLALLRTHARALPFDRVSGIVRLDERALAGPWPIRGLAYERLEDVVHVAAALARDLRDVPKDAATVALGFAVAPGRGCEPATFGLMRLTNADGGGDWWWQCSCKTQYASIVDDEHLVRCHGAVIALLDAAAARGVDVMVCDETGYWDSRDARELVASVARMNRLIARFAGALTDAIRDDGGDSRQLQGAIFEHPDFERLEMER